MTTSRTYRLTAQDRTGWFLGLDAAQVTTLTAALLGGALLARRGAYTAATGIVPLGLAVAFLRVGGESLHRVVGPLVAFTGRRALGRHRSFAKVAPPGSSSPELPRALGAVEVTTVPAGPLARFAGDPEVAVVTDRKSRRATISIRVSGDGFTLADPADQDRFCAGWGDALAACAAAPTAPAAVQVTVRSAPETGVVGAVRREALVTIVADRHLRRSADTAPVVTEAARLADRLMAAGLSVDGVLDAAAWATTVRETFDPCGQAERARSLGERAGVSHPASAGPLAVVQEWSAVRVDGSWHRAYLVAEWPRVEVPASWLAGLAFCEGPTWSLTVSFEPVPARKARQAIERQAAKLSSDEEQRRRAGFRVGATHQRHQEDLAAREAELVAGHAEYEYAGIAVVSAETLAALDEDSATLVAAAAASGIELRPLHGRHLAGLGASLPVPAGLHRTGQR